MGTARTKFAAGDHYNRTAVHGANALRVVRCAVEFAGAGKRAFDTGVSPGGRGRGDAIAVRQPGGILRRASSASASRRTVALRSAQAVTGKEYTIWTTSKPPHKMSF